MFSTLYGTYFSFQKYFKMSYAIRFNLDQCKILSSGNGLSDQHRAKLWGKPIVSWTNLTHSCSLCYLLSCSLLGYRAIVFFCQFYQPNRLLMGVILIKIRVKVVRAFSILIPTNWIVSQARTRTLNFKSDRLR